MKKILLGLILVLSVVASLSAEKIIFSANSMTGKSDDSNGETKLEGNAYIKTESMEIKANSIILSAEPIILKILCTDLEIPIIGA